jgi:hypothetical protein
VRKEKKATPLPEGVQIGSLVSYYDEGWRTARLASVEGIYAYLQPLVYGHKKHDKKVPIADIKRVEK